MTTPNDRDVNSNQGTKYHAVLPPGTWRAVPPYIEPDATNGERTIEMVWASDYVPDRTPTPYFLWIPVRDREYFADNGLWFLNKSNQSAREMIKKLYRAHESKSESDSEFDW